MFQRNPLVTPENILRAAKQVDDQFYGLVKFSQANYPVLRQMDWRLGHCKHHRSRCRQTLMPMIPEVAYVILTSSKIGPVHWVVFAFLRIAITERSHYGRSECAGRANESLRGKRSWH